MGPIRAMILSRDNPGTFPCEQRSSPCLVGVNRAAHSRNKSDSKVSGNTGSLTRDSHGRNPKGGLLEAFRNQLSLGWLFPASHDNFASAHSFDDIELAQHADCGVDLG